MRPVLAFLCLLAACSDDAPPFGGEGCGPNHPCPTNFTCNTKASPPVCEAAEVPQVELTVAISGNGSVQVSQNPSCTGATCDYSVDRGSTVTLTAMPAAGSHFLAWSGSCSGTTPVVTVSLDAAKTCTADFAADAAKLDVTITAGTGGTISTSPALSCSATSCTGQVAAGSTISLTATAATGSRFSGWTGSPVCDGSTTSPLSIAVTAAVSCTAHFVARVTVTGAVQAGLGGTVQATSPSVNKSCAGASCTVDTGDTVTLVAPTVTDHRLTGWTGTGCSAGTVSGSGLTLMASADLTCTASYALGVSVSGTVVGATGTVMALSSSPGASCANGTCALDAGGTVTLTAPDLSPGFRFAGWSGDAACVGTNRVLALSEVQQSLTCQAGYRQRVTISGAMQSGVQGAVTVTSSDAASTCSGMSCVVDAGKTVELQAPSVPGFFFKSWSSAACGTMQDTTLTATANLTCTAQYRVTISAAIDPAHGTLATAPASCPQGGSTTSCAVDLGTDVTFTVTPDDDWKVGGWIGTGCAASGASATVHATVPTSCTASLVKESWAETLGNGMASIPATALLPFGAGFAVAAQTTASTGAQVEWLLPIDPATGATGAATQFSGASLPTDGFEVASGDMVTAGGDVIFVRASSDPNRSPLVARWSPGGSPLATITPFALPGLTTGSNRPSALAVTGDDVWLGSTVETDLPTGSQVFVARLTRIDRDGHLKVDFGLQLTRAGNMCNGDSSFGANLDAMTDVGDGLIVALTSSPLTDSFVVAKVGYDGRVHWAKRTAMAPSTRPRPARAFATPGGGAVIVGSVTNDSDKDNAFYAAFAADGGPGIGGRSYGKALTSTGGSAELFAGAPDRGGGLVLVGSISDAASAADGWLVRIDDSDAIVAQMRYGGSARELLTGVAVLSDGYLVSGTTTSFGAPFGGRTLVVRTDADLNVAFSPTSQAHEAEAEAGFDQLVAGDTDAACVINPPVFFTGPTAQTATVGDLSAASVLPTAVELAP